MLEVGDRHFVSGWEFARLCIAPTGSPLYRTNLNRTRAGTARNELIQYGVSQIDSGTKIELRATPSGKESRPERGQFHIGDDRT